MNARKNPYQGQRIGKQVVNVMRRTERRAVKRYKSFSWIDKTVFNLLSAFQNGKNNA
jgi:hypothetical protein